MSEGNENAGRYVELTREEALAAFDGDACIACGGAKRPRYAFCKADWLLLTWQLRADASRGADHPGFVDGVRRALQHLVWVKGGDGRQRARFAEGADGRVRWRYTSEAELEAAGYRFIQHARCAAPLCGARVIWFWTPNQKRMAVDAETVQPHAAGCKDPEWLKFRQERRVLRTSARRRRTRRTA